MITEKMIVAAVQLLHGHRWTISTKTGADTVTESVQEHAMPPGVLLRSLLSQYSLSDAEGVVRWLEIGDYVGYTGWGFAPKQLLVLTMKGVNLAQTGELEPSERQLVYREDPYTVFVARQFRDEDAALYEHLRDSVLTPLGLVALDGKVDGIEAFRGEILRKIALARFFVCILTRRAELKAGGFASSVWLYQETGAAVALGKKPLVVVESGLDDHYAGELQKNYEYVSFERASFQNALQEVGRRIVNDLTANHIPLLRHTAT